ncbi:MAG: AtpZ/AtpI family protein [Acidobacteriia bacterium]|nr:AtpZ/AtpI family protein [Terriglobia bacterium]
MATEDPSPPLPPAPRKRPATVARQISDVMDLPFTLVACIAIGGGLGYYLDARFHTSPIFTLILGLLGFAAGMIQLVRRLSKDTKDDGAA